MLSSTAPLSFAPVPVGKDVLSFSLALGVAAPGAPGTSGLLRLMFSLPLDAAALAVWVIASRIVR